jgi:hypothetical protein
MLQISGTFDLVQPGVTGPKTSQDYLGTLSLHVSAEPGLEEYCRGSRVLQVRAPATHLRATARTFRVAPRCCY